MEWSLLLWFMYFAATFAQIFFVINQLLYLTDLEADTLNIFDATETINRWIIPEFALQGLVSLCFLCTMKWIMLLLALPITCFHLYLYLKRKHFIDVTEVFRGIEFEKKFRVFKLVYYLIFSTILLFRLVWLGTQSMRNAQVHFH